MVASRFGVVGVVILLLGYCALTQFGGGSGGLLQSPSTSTAPSGQSTLDPHMKDFLTRVLGSTEETWGEIFSKSGSATCRRAMVAYTQRHQSGCGAAQSAMGPFYCPTDKQIYLDPAFFNELSQRFGAPGDFAQAYVIAHEVGHHVQDLQGTLDQAHSPRHGASEAQGMRSRSRWSCRPIAMQACGRRTRGTPKASIRNRATSKKGMRAAEAIGDDTLQRQSQGVVVPESFTHGTSAQRKEALLRGYKSGNPDVCKF